MAVIGSRQIEIVRIASSARFRTLTFKFELCLPRVRQGRNQTSLCDVKMCDLCACALDSVHDVDRRISTNTWHMSTCGVCTRI